MLLTHVTIDFETKSACNLKKAGAERYSQDPTTEILVLSYKRRDERAVWRWYPGEPGSGLVSLAEDPNVTFIAHSAAFEKGVWRNIMVPVFGFPDIPDARWHDTQAVCAMKALPLDLERVVHILRLPFEKDMEGNALTLGLSKIDKKTGAFPPVTPAILERVGSYCDMDVVNQDALHNRLGWLPPGERRVWLLDQRINRRGVPLDIDYIRQARLVVDGAFKPLNEEFRGITSLNVTQGKKFLEWLGFNGLDLPNLKKETVAELLGESEEEDDNEVSDEQPGSCAGVLASLPGYVRRAVYIRKLIGSASVKKLAAMEQCIGEDNRARGLLQYHGATPGRWTGRLLQPQNFPRGTLKVDGYAPDPQALVDAILTGDHEYVEMLFGPAVEAVVSSLRHAIVASPGKLLVAGDFAGIEARIVLALAGQRDVVESIKLHGSRRAYLDMAAKIAKRPIDKDQDPEEYVIGKCTILGCGFQMGGETFKNRYGKKLTLEQCKEAVRTYREDYAPMVPKVWRALEAASLATVRERCAHEAYGVEYRLEDAWLTARLPSGRKLWYFAPKMDRKAMPWDANDIRECWSYQAMKMGRWTTIYAYGGHETENVVQALARDRMVHSMFLAEKEDLGLILTVHDELVCETEEKRADPKLLQQIMEDQPAWAIEMGAPIVAEAWAGERYKK